MDGQNQEPSKPIDRNPMAENGANAAHEADSTRTATATCKQGVLVGTSTNGVMAFQNIPYAQDGGRFKKAIPPMAWDGSRDATKPGPIFPQSSRPIVMHSAEANGGAGGYVELEQTEDAFRLSIWTSSTSASLPVIFWVHGGGYSSGGCSMPTYDGSQIARTKRAVVVGVNYRLGALGNLYMPGVVDQNLAVEDLKMALAWVRENIAAFGGDPDNICLTGQSAGAWYVLALAVSEELSGSFSKIMLMSVPGSGPLMEEDATELATSFMKHLHAKDQQKLFSASVEKILHAQRSAARDSKHFGISFMPNVSPELKPDLIGQAIETCGSSVPLLDGLVSEESAFFISGLADVIRGMSESERLAFVSGFGDDDPSQACEDYADEEDPYVKMVRITTRQLFGLASDRLLEGFSNSYGYRFNRKSPNPLLMACHCLDLPFFFDNLANWERNDMVSGINAGEFEELAGRFQNAILTFVETGAAPWGGSSEDKGREIFE